VKPAGDPVAVFEGQRPRLFGLAYRMLGSAAEAEDVVQDAYLHWSGTDHAAVAAPAAWLTTAVVNLAPDYADGRVTFTEFLTDRFG
jgi:DNA-directed RNA polymerase specialized sigma24 family protein